MLRSCYSTFMRFYRDGQNTLTRIQWYFTRSQQNMPFAHAFDSSVYSCKDQVQWPIGELYLGKRWSNGKPAVAPTSGGLCGSEYQWQNGAAFTDPMPELWPDTGTPRCCLRPPPWPVGGIAYGGEVKFIYRAEGGVAYGGWSSNPADQLPEGGVAYGGSARVWDYLGITGGLAYGGSVRTWPVESVSGGIAYGGTVRTWPAAKAEGGVAYGGAVVEGFAGSFKGGAAYGGKCWIARVYPGPVFDGCACNPYCT